MFRIETLHAWVAIDEDDEESVCGFLANDGTWMPMVMADEKRMESVRPMAERIARETGRKLTLVRFTNRENVETLG